MSCEPAAVGKAVTATTTAVASPDRRHEFSGSYSGRASSSSSGGSDSDENEPKKQQQPQQLQLHQVLAGNCSAQKNIKSTIISNSQKSDVLPSTSTAQTSGSSENGSTSRRSVQGVKGNNFGATSSWKRKPASPKKRPVMMQEPVMISAETGEILDDDTGSSFEERRRANAKETNAKKECSIADDANKISEVQRLVHEINGCMSSKLANATERKPKIEPSTETQFNDLGSSNAQSMNDLLMNSGSTAALTAAMSSFLLASAAAGSDMANAFLSPEIFSSAAASGFYPFMGLPFAVDAQNINGACTAYTNPYYQVPSSYSPDLVQLDENICTEPLETVIVYQELQPVQHGDLDPLEMHVLPSESMPSPLLEIDESMSSEPYGSNMNIEQQNMLFLEAAVAAGAFPEILANCDTSSDVPNNFETKPLSVPSTSVSVETKNNGKSNNAFATEDNGIKSHNRRLRVRSTAHSGTGTVSEQVNNLLSMELQHQSNRANYSSALHNEKISLKRRIMAADEEAIKSAARAITKEERIDLEELESFAQTFKKQRIKFGFTQGDVGLALGRRYGTDFSQTTISRFEALNLSFKNMCKLRPLLKEWLADAEAAIANGASISDLLEAPAKEPATQTIIMGASITSNTHTADGSPSPNNSIVSTSGLPLKKRRKRTNLDLAQRAALDTYFKLNPRPDHDRMAQIAEVLDLDRDVVRVWFCNRRQKVRKE